MIKKEPILNPIPYLNVDSNAIPGSVVTGSKKCGQLTLRFNVSYVENKKMHLDEIMSLRINASASQSESE